LEKKGIYRKSLSLLSPSSLGVTSGVPFVELLRRSAMEAQKRPTYPWGERLQTVRGTVSRDGVERISTQALFDFLELPQRERTPANCRTLSALMREKGWTAVRLRGISGRGYRDQVRGYARDR
jgi:hypothetical protein